MQCDGHSDRLRGRRIMIVEDEGLILLTIRDIVEGLGCEVAAAEARSQRALAAVETVPIDAALLDVNLGRNDTSYPIADALAARNIPFAFLTGYGSGSLHDGHKDRPVLTKPVDEQQLVAMLAQLLGSAPPPAA